MFGRLQNMLMQEGRAMSMSLGAIGDDLALARGVLLTGESLQALSHIDAGSEPDSIQWIAIGEFGEFLKELAQAAELVAAGKYSPVVASESMLIPLSKAEEMVRYGGGGTDVDYEAAIERLNELAAVCSAVGQPEADAPDSKLAELRDFTQALRSVLLSASLDASYRDTLF